MQGKARTQCLGLALGFATLACGSSAGGGGGAGVGGGSGASQYRLSAAEGTIELDVTQLQAGCEVKGVSSLSFALPATKYTESDAVAYGATFSVSAAIDIHESNGDAQQTCPGSAPSVACSASDDDTSSSVGLMGQLPPPDSDAPPEFGMYLFLNVPRPEPCVYQPLFDDPSVGRVGPLSVGQLSATHIELVAKGEAPALRAPPEQDPFGDGDDIEVSGVVRWDYRFVFDALP